jgi:hypothetical protein
MATPRRWRGSDKNSRLHRSKTPITTYTPFSLTCFSGEKHMVCIYSEVPFVYVFSLIFMHDSDHLRSKFTPESSSEKQLQRCYCFDKRLILYGNGFNINIFINLVFFGEAGLKKIFTMTIKPYHFFWSSSTVELVVRKPFIICYGLDGSWILLFLRFQYTVHT